MGKISTLLTLDGDSEFKRKLKEINERLATLGKQEKALSSELVDQSMKMQQAAKVMANLGNQLDLLKTKQGVLSQALRNAEGALDQSRLKYAKLQEEYTYAKKNIDTVRNALATAKLVYGENSAEVQKLAEKLKRLEAAEKNLAQGKKELDNNANAVLKLKQQLADTETQIHRTEAEQKRWNDSLRQGGNELKRIDWNNVANSFKTIGSELGKAATNAGQLALKAGELAGVMARAEFNAFKLTMQGITTELQLGTDGVKLYAEQFGKAAVEVGKFATSNGMSFEASMSKVKAYSAVSDEEMERLEAAARRMGETTSKTAAESADALGYLALSGYKTEDMLNSLEPVVKAAEAGNMDLAQAAYQTGTALKVSGLKTEDTEEFLNVLTAVQNNTKASLSTALETYVGLGAVFNDLHADMYESSTLIGRMAEQGVEGSEAVTSLNTLLLRLQETNENSMKALDSIDVHAWENGKFIGLTNLLRKISEKTATMSEEDRTQLYAQLFGVRQYTRGDKLISAAADVEAYDRLYDIVSHASENNTLYKTSETMLDNLKGDITLLRSATEALGISIYKTFSDEASNKVERFTKYVNILTNGVNNGFPEMQKALVSVGTGLSDMVVNAIADSAKQLPQTLALYNTAILQGVRILINSMRVGKNRVIQPLITGAKDLAIELIKKLPEFTSVFIDGAVIFYTCLIDAMKETATELTKVLPDVINTLVNAIDQNGAALLEGGFEILMILGDGIIQNLPTLLSLSVRIIHGLIDGIDEHIDEILEGAEIIILGLTDAIVDVLDGDKVVKLLGIGGKIIGKICEVLVDEEVLAKLGTAAIDVVNALSLWLVTNSGPIFEEKVPEMIDKLIEQFTSPDNKAAMYEAGENLGGALLIGLGHMLKGIIKLYIKEYERSIAMWFGFEGEGATHMANIFEGIRTGDMKSLGQAMADMAVYAANNREEATKMFADAEAYSKYGIKDAETFNRLAIEDAHAYANSMYGVEFDDSGSVAMFPDGSYGPFMPSAYAVNLYSPVFNNMGDMENIIEQTSQMIDAQVAGGGKN